MEGMGQSLSIHREMTFNSRDLLTSIISFVLGAVSVLYALSIHDTEASFFLPTVAASGLANQLFLRPLPAGNLPLGRVSHSIAGNTCSKCASWESLLAACATESRFSRHTAPQRKHHTNPRAGLSPAACRLQNGQHQGKLLPTDIAGIGMRHPYPPLVIVST